LVNRALPVTILPMKTKRLVAFDTTLIDQTVRPQDDFFHFACGGWLKKNPVPESEASWGTFYKLRDQVLKQTKKILEDINAKKSVLSGSEASLIQVLYRSGMDIKRRNREGLTPIKETLEKIDSIATVSDVRDFLVQSEKDGSGILWSFFVAEDEKDSERYITYLAQGGLTLPERDFYLAKDARSQKIQVAYTKYIQKILQELGDTQTESKNAAKKILALETKIAKVSMDKVRRRDVENIYNKKTVSALTALAPKTNWKRYMKEIGLENVKSVVVMQPEFIKKVDLLIEQTPVETWKQYLRFSTLDDAAPYLTQTLSAINFNFFGRVIAGHQRPKPEWKRVLATINATIGYAVGKEYVKRYFSPQAKKKINELVDYLFIAYEHRIKEIDWMSPATKKKALIKLSQMERKLGYPDKWESYKGLRLSEKSPYFTNIVTSVKFEQKKLFKKLGKKVDRKEWFMPPQTVNAYYNANQNEIVFSAAILQPPFFYPELDDAVNFGAMGSVIGHEITHGFDDQGSKFDGKGNFKNWWTKQDKERFTKKANVLVKQFNQYKVGDLSVNGKLTLGENIADLGGLAIAYDAYMHYLKTHPSKTIKGYTPQQRFFMGLALFECAHARAEWARTLVLIDPHSPSITRVNGPMSNLQEFYDAFNVQKGDALYRPPHQRAKIW